MNQGMLSFLATIMGSAMALSNGFQAIKIFQRKSSSDVAVSTYLIITIGEIVWIMYGISINSFPLVISNSIGLVLTTIIIFGYFIYKDRK